MGAALIPGLTGTAYGDPATDNVLIVIYSSDVCAGPVVQADAKTMMCFPGPGGSGYRLQNLMELSTGSWWAIYVSISGGC